MRREHERGTLGAEEERIQETQQVGRVAFVLQRKKETWVKHQHTSRVGQRGEHSSGRGNSTKV